MSTGSGMVKMKADPMLFGKAEEKTRLVETVDQARETCEYCRPVTPITCATGCRIWKLRNELRGLHEKTGNANFMRNLLNTLKNKRRLKILEILSKGQHSIVRLQQKLKKLDYYHSQETIAEEYVEPLVQAGLVGKSNSKYHTTMFGYELDRLIKNSNAVAELLPPHSKCYEEKAIEVLSEGPKTYEELKSAVPPESLSRVLKRLQQTGLMTKSNENSHIFYHRTKRNSCLEKLSPTEKRAYAHIPEEGITVQKLADKTDISLRRTYKYLRKLRGKKLVFRRRCPKVYVLTTEGSQIAKLLDETRTLLVQFDGAHQSLQLNVFT
jgi:DNA-binding HxlR family transcriptional regulator